MHALALKNLMVGFDGKPVAQIDAMLVQSGSIVVLAGPNGVGKSTVLKTIARQIPAIKGTVSIGQLNALDAPVKDFAKQLAYVPQMIEPARKITVRDLVALGRNPHQMWWRWELDDADRMVVDDALKQLDIVNLSQKLLSNLSGGERQRAIIAMALAQQTPFILMDEPSAHLDFKHQLQLLKTLQALKHRGLGVLLVLHDLSLIARVADEVILLRKDEPYSTVAAAGSVDKVLTPAVLQQVYGVDVSVSVDVATGLKSFLPIGP